MYYERIRNLREDKELKQTDIAEENKVKITIKIIFLKMALIHH